MALSLTDPQLLESCGLAFRNIVARLDRERSYQPYFRVDLGPPARAVHDSWDYCDMAGRYVESLVLLRRLARLSDDEAEEGLKRFLLANQSPEDGLFYNREGPGSRRAADMFCQSRVLLGLCAWYRESGDARALEALRRLARALPRIAVWRDGCALYPRNLYRDGEWLEGGLFYDAKDLWTVKPGYGGTQIEGLMEYYRLSGDESVLPFVEGYLRYFLEAARVVDEEGRYEGHLHSQGIVPTMVGAALYAEATGDAALLERCVRFLRFTQSHCSSFGWVPDGIGWPTCETCALADVLRLALELSRLTPHRFHDVMERFARNQLPESQFRSAARVLRGRDAEPGLEALIVGSFASWARPNDLLGGPDIEGCCTASGVRAIADLCDHAVEYRQDGALLVHLPLGLDTDAAQVETGLPWEGWIRVRPRRRLRVLIRCPESVPSGELRVRAAGEEEPARAAEGYVEAGVVEPGTAVELRYPLKDRLTEETIAGQRYRMEWHGGLVVKLSPRGTGYPTYLRRKRKCGLQRG